MDSAPLHNLSTIEAMRMRLGGYMVHPKMFSLMSTTGSDDVI